MKQKFKYLLTFTITSLLLFCASFGIFSYFLHPKKIAHVYIDLASVPAVFQMIDALTQNPNDPKFIILKRFKALDNNDTVLKSINAQMIDATFLGEKKYEEFSELINKSLLDFYKKHNDFHFIIHFNLHHVPEYKDFFQIIPANQIIGVHLYEDSLGRSLWDAKSFFIYKNFFL